MHQILMPDRAGRNRRTCYGNPATHAMADGFHGLAPTSNSGAIDYVRDPLISEPRGCLTVLYSLLSWITGQQYQVWRQNVGMSA